MTSFGRSTRQGVIWDEMQDIRDTVGSGLLGPDDGEYTGDDGELQVTWAAAIVEYRAIHTENETRG